LTSSISWFNDLLLLTTSAQVMFQRTAVSSSERWYQNPPSPENSTTGRSGAASLAPSAAGSPQPSEPAARMNDWSGWFRSTMPPVHMPLCPVSETRIASDGNNRVRSLQTRSGRSGTASESSSGPNSSRQSAANAAARSRQGCREAAVESSAISSICSSTVVASPQRLTRYE